MGYGPWGSKESDRTERLTHTSIYMYIYIYIHIHVCIYIYSNIIKPEIRKIMPFSATWMDLEIVILSEVSQTKKDKYDIFYMWNIKKKMVQMSLFSKQK